MGYKYTCTVQYIHHSISQIRFEKHYMRVFSMLYVHKCWTLEVERNWKEELGEAMAE